MKWKIGFFIFLYSIAFGLLAWYVYASDTRPLIIIDAGHGGKDPGAPSVRGTFEKDIALQLSSAIGEQLKKEKFDVVYTRTDDSTVSLQERIALANRYDEAILFISLHANTVDRPEVNGLQVLYYPDHNGANQSTASFFVETISTQLNIPNRGAIARKELAVLRGTPMTSLLIESGFITNWEEATALENPRYQRQFAKAVTKTVQQYVQSQNE